MERDLYQNKARSLIKKLVWFLGENNIQRSLNRHEQSLRSSSFVFREYYLKNRHPWMNAFMQYYKLIERAKSIHKNLTPELKDLVDGAKKVTDLQHNMPDSVKNKYRKVLLDDDRAYHYLFEIEIAWHFFARSWNIKWYEDDSSKHPEFTVGTPGFNFDVECKWISVNIARKIHREDFYRLADKLIPEIKRRGYAGRLDIVLKDRLESGIIDELCAKIVELIGAGCLRGNYELAPFGSLALDLSYASGIVIDMNKHVKELWERKADNAHGEIFARSDDGRPVDPIELTLISEKADKVLDEIKERISDAAETQLDESKPGLIACFLEGVNAFELCELKDKSGLKNVTDYVLSKDKFSHVIGISYSSERMVEKGGGFEEIFNPALFFRNPKCKFEKAKTFNFLSSPQF